VLRVGRDRGGGADLDDPAQVHHRDPPAHVRHRGQVVGDEEVGKLQLLLEVGQEIEDLGPDRDVERRHGLVEHDQLRRERQRPREGDALPLAPRQLVREQRGGATGQADEIEQPLDARADLRARVALVGHERLGDDLVHPHPGVERRVGVLEHRLHRAAILADGAGVERDERAAEEADRAARGLLELQDEARRRRLPASGLADEAEARPGRDAPRDVVDRAHDTALAAKEAALQGEVLDEVLDLEHRAAVVHAVVCSRHAAAEATGGSSSQHRTACAAVSRNSGGSVARHRSIALTHRGWNAHPPGSMAGSGGWPSIAVSRPRLAVIRGIDSRSAVV
jgi:hypothetical protein